MRFSTVFAHSKRIRGLIRQSKRIMSTDQRIVVPDLNMQSAKVTALDEFLEKTQRLLKLEREAEEEQNRLLIETRSLDELCQAGVALKKLHLIDRRPGLGGRLLLKFGYNDSSPDDEHGPALPNHKITPGDIVNLCSSADHRSPQASGVVSKVVERSITVAFDGENSRNDDGSGQLSMSALINHSFSIVQSVNDVTFRRLTATLDALSMYKKFPGWILVEYLFGIRRIPAVFDGRSIDQESASGKSSNAAFESVDQIMSTDFGGLSTDNEVLSKHGGLLIDEKSNDHVEIISDSNSTDHTSDHRQSFGPPAVIARSYSNKTLNRPQHRAIEFCLHDHHPISIIHGPPGTGKTTVVVEIIRQLVKNRKKVLACAPSNVAVDNLLEKLVSIDSDQSINVVRLGHPARTHSNVQRYSLDLIMKQREYSEVLDDIRREIEALDKEKNRRYANSQRKLLRRELFERERLAVKSILKNASVVCGTLTSITRDGPLGNLLKADEDPLSIFSIGRKFDVAVIDECGQATELACWATLLATSGEKCILAGDHRQLPPTIISDQAAREGFDRSLMARVVSEFGDGIVNVLTVQYRMNSEIMNWPSENVYDGQLEADDDVAKRLLSHLPNVEPMEETSAPLWLIDTADCDMSEIVTADDESKANIGEIRLVYLHVDRLVRSGVPQQSIAIISPYNLQVQLMRTYIGGVYPHIAIRSVDGFQGQERDAVILSLVRSNPRGEVGFLADRRRMNVAVTRAKRHLAIIGDGRMVSADRFLRSLMEYMTKTGVVKSALEYEDDYYLVPFSINFGGLALIEKSAPTAAVAIRSSSKSAKLKSSSPNISKPEASDAVVGEKEKAKKQYRLDADGDKSVLNWRKEFSSQLEEFALDEDRDRLVFPPELPAYQRAYVHEIAERMGLTHFSENVGSERRIVVDKRKNDPSSIPSSACASVDLVLSDQKSIDFLSIDAPSAITDASTPQIALDSAEPQPNLMKNLVQEKIKSGKAKKKPKSIDQSKSSIRPIDRDATKSKSIAQSASAENDDEFMERFADEERRCKFAGCREVTALISEKCRFCIQIFCFKHAMPEIHGCGEAAKRHARMEYEMTASTKMTKSNSVNAEKRETLQAKLDRKLKSMKGQRQQKSK